MRALKIILGTLSALMGIVWLVGIFLPGEYRVERSTVVDAPAAVVFAQVNSFPNWEAWSPWIAHDPTVKNTYAGPAEGVGSSASWTSEESGEGTMTITESKPNEHITVGLDFGGMGEAQAYFDFEPAGDGTRVTWSMEGENEGAIGHYFAAAMDGMVGPYFEEGLAALKERAETLPAPPAPEALPAEQPVAQGEGTEEDAQDEAAE